MDLVSIIRNWVCSDHKITVFRTLEEKTRANKITTLNFRGINFALVRVLLGANSCDSPGEKRDPELLGHLL